MEKYDVIVVGAGISGLLSALALSKERKNVLVLEKSSVAGGNCRTYMAERTGFLVDTGVHAITCLRYGPLVKLMNKYFSVTPKFIPHGEYYIRYPSGFAHFPNTVKGFLAFEALPASDRRKLTKIVFSAITHLGMKGKRDITAYDFVKDKGISETGMRLIDALSYFSSGLSMKETPAWRILSAGGLISDSERRLADKIADFFHLAINKSYHEQGYPLGGIQTITNCVIQSLPKNATIKTGEDVARIERIKGGFNITTPKGNYFSETVVYSGEAKRLPELIEMPHEWVAMAKSIKQSRAMTVWLGFKKPLSAFSYRGSEVWFAHGVSYWAMPTSNYDPHLAPKGKQLVGFSSFLPDSENPKKFEKALLGTIFSAVPEAEKNAEMKHVQIFIPEKAAISAGVKFPSVKTPIKNLYLVGTDADMRSMGITRAAYSVIEMLEKSGNII